MIRRGQCKVYFFQVCLIIVTCLCLLLSFNCGTGGQDQTIRIMTFNLHHCEGTDSVYSVERIAQFIKDYNADIVLCQEVDNGFSERSHNEDQPHILENSLGYHSYYGPNIGDTYGNLILSRFPLEKSKNLGLPNPEDKEPRGIIVTSFTVSGLTFSLMNTHLSAFSAINRDKQVVFIKSLIDSGADTIILGADFNTTPSEQLQPLFDNNRLLSTRHILGNDEAIDDILVSTESQVMYCKRQSREYRLFGSSGLLCRY